MTVLLFILGLVLLIAGAEALVRGASKLALSFGISPLVVGLTVVAFGTSSPETAVSVQSAYAGEVDIALGNVVGSNIFNVLFILGISALIAPLVVHQQLIRQEVPVTIGASLLLLAFASDSDIARWEGLVFLAGLVTYTAFLVRQSRRETQAIRDEYAQEFGEPEVDTSWDRHRPLQLLLIVTGLAMLVVGSNWLVDGAVAFAEYLGVSALVIGLTIVAAGTSLPEVATSILATVKGERDIAVGNVIGSCTFNIVAVLGAASVAAPDGLSVAPAILNFDLWVMLAAIVACLPVFFTGHLIARWEGGLFFGYYAAYTTYVILFATRHDALGPFSLVMLAFVIPLTAVTLFVGVWRDVRRARA